jgi:hypothetical protein
VNDASAAGQDAPSHVPLLIAPALIFLGIIGSVYVFPDWLDDLFTGFGLEFLITFWIGAGFTFAWDKTRHSLNLEGVSPAAIAAIGILSAIVILSMLGGISILWEDPWIFGVAVWPGFALARPWLNRSLDRSRHGRYRDADSEEGTG